MNFCAGRNKIIYLGDHNKCYNFSGNIFFRRRCAVLFPFFVIFFSTRWLPMLRVTFYVCITFFFSIIRRYSFPQEFVLMSLSFSSPFLCIIILNMRLCEHFTTNQTQRNATYHFRGAIISFFPRFSLPPSSLRSSSARLFEWKASHLSISLTHQISKCDSWYYMVHGGAWQSKSSWKTIRQNMFMVLSYL